MKNLWLILLSLFFCCSSIAAQVTVSGETLLVGPTLGAVTPAETPVFFVVEKGNNASQFGVRIRETVSGITHLPYETLPLCSGDVCAYIANFANLPVEKSLKVYVYRNNTIQEQSLTEFTVPGNGVQDFNFLIGSCAAIGTGTGPREDIFPQMASEDAEFMIWLGDMVYLPYDLDTTLAFDTYLRYSTLSPRRNQLFKSFFHFGMWDDHDYSYNNGTADYSDKDYTASLFKHWLPNPNYEHPSTTGGIQSNYKYRDVEFFNTDVRYYKTANDHLGQTQLNWLKQRLLQSNATFKFVQVGTPVLDERTNNNTETSMWQTGERQELFDFIYANNVEGVIFFTGDLHRSHFVKYNPGCNSTYPFYEFMSSPLTSGASSSSTIYAGAFYESNTHSYGKISVSGPSGNRALLLQNKDVNGTVIGSFSINENELKLSGIADDDPATALRAHYPLDNSANDVSGNQFHGTFTGTNLSTTPNRFLSNNDAMKISTGGSQFKTIALPSQVLNNLLDVTISFWSKPEVQAAGLVSGASSTYGNEVLMYYGANKNYSIFFKNNALLSKDTFDLSEWHHVVATHRGSTGLTQLYVDGEFQGEEVHLTGPLSVVSLLCLNDQDGAGGGNLDPNQQFYGEVDDLRIYDKALCLYQIEDLYRDGIPELTAISSPLLCNPPVTATFQATGTTNGNYRWYHDPISNFAIANATNSAVNATITESKTLWVAAYTPWQSSRRIPVTRTVGPTIYTDATTYTNPVELTASYPIKGHGADETGNYPGLSGSGTVWRTGMDGGVNGAIGFDSYPDILTVPNTTLDMAERATVSFWIKTTDSGCGVFSAANRSFGNGLLFFINADGHSDIWMNNGHRVFQSPNINDGNWHHVAITFDGVNALVHPYLDGVHMEVINWGSFRPRVFDIPNGALVFGNDQDGAGGGGYQTNQQFEGSIDEIKLYRRLLSEDEIEVLAARNDVVQEPFQTPVSPTVLCANDTTRLQLYPLQEGINYSVENQSGAPIATTSYMNADTLVFEFPVNQSITVNLTAEDQTTGCTNDFAGTNLIRVAGCLELEGWLLGAYDSNTASMRDDLRQKGLIPLSGPNGPLKPELLATTGAKALVDWVMIELREPGSPSTVAFSRSGLLLADGTIISEDGKTLSFPTTINGSYYVMLKHRNHLPAMTDVPIMLPVSGTTAYNFKTQYGYSLGLGNSQIQLPGSSEYAMFPGDGDPSGNAGYDLNGADLIIWQSENGMFNDYLNGDFNMNGDVNGSDKILMLPYNGVFSNVPR